MSSVPISGMAFSGTPVARTLTGFRTWNTSPAVPEKAKACFLDGEIFLDRSGEEVSTHGQVKLAILWQLKNVVNRRGSGYLFPDGTQVTVEAANLCAMPDGAFCTEESFQSGKVRLVPRRRAAGQFVELEGPPDWVMEVVSDSSVAKDRTQLRELYHRAGVAEYWLIDARGEEIRFQILYWAKDGYEAAPLGRAGWQASRVFGRRFRLTREATAIGLWRYKLEVKSDRGRAGSRDTAAPES